MLNLYFYYYPNPVERSKIQCTISASFLNQILFVEGCVDIIIIINNNLVLFGQFKQLELLGARKDVLISI